MIIFSLEPMDRSSLKEILKLLFQAALFQLPNLARKNDNDRANIDSYISNLEVGMGSFIKIVANDFFTNKEYLTRDEWVSCVTITSYRKCFLWSVGLRTLLNQHNKYLKNHESSSGARSDVSGCIGNGSG